MESTLFDKPQKFGSYTRNENAKLVFSRIPTFEFYIQRFSLPGISIGTVQMSGRTGTYSRPGEILQFEKPLNLEIILDEDYRSLQEIYNWLIFFADPNLDPERDFDKIVSDARIVVLNNEKSEEVGSIHFLDVYPIGMSSLSYAHNDSSPAPLKFNASFDYSTYEINFDKKSICSVV